MTKHEEFRRKLWIAVCSGPNASTIFTREQQADFAVKEFDKRFKEEAPPEDPMVCEGLNPIVGRCIQCDKPVKRHSCVVSTKLVGHYCNFDCMAKFCKQTQL